MQVSERLAAFLTTIAYAEDTLRRGKMGGYDVKVGGELFKDFSDHPRVAVWCKKFFCWSTAAGRYQILRKLFDFYKEELGLPDFSPESQDKIAIRMIAECRALVDIQEGNIESAINKCSSRWASFPGAGYGQKERKMSDLLAFYDKELERIK